MSKLLSRSLRLLAAFAFMALCAADARAFVGLSLTDGDGTPSSTVVLPGSSFTVTASLLSTVEKITGVDYYLQITNNGAGKFRILDRNIGASQFSDLIKSDTGDNGANPGIEDATVSLLNPRNGLDLGAGIANVNSPLNAGSYTLATFTISVPSNVAPGTYVLSTMSDPGTGWVGTAPLFPESTFSQQGSFTITVNGTGGSVPEPGGIALATGMIGLFLRRR